MEIWTPDKLRIFFEEETGEHPIDNDAEIVISKSGDGCLRIAVGEEHAVDSYNKWFDCSIKLSQEQTEKLFQWLKEHFKYDW